MNNNIIQITLNYNNNKNNNNNNKEEEEEEEEEEGMHGIYSTSLAE